MSGGHAQIYRLSHEYPTATCSEIAMAVGETVPLVRSALRRSAVDDAKEVAYRAAHGLPPAPDYCFVGIMMKRIGRSCQVDRSTMPTEK